MDNIMYEVQEILQKDCYNIKMEKVKVPKNIYLLYCFILNITRP